MGQGQLVLGILSNQKGIIYEVPNAAFLHSTTNSTHELVTIIANVVANVPQENWPAFWKHIKTQATIINARDDAKNGYTPPSNATTSSNTTTSAFYTALKEAGTANMAVVSLAWDVAATTFANAASTPRAIFDSLHRSFSTATSFAMGGDGIASIQRVCMGVWKDIRNAAGDLCA